MCMTPEEIQADNEAWEKSDERKEMLKDFNDNQASFGLEEIEDF